MPRHRSRLCPVPQPGAAPAVAADFPQRGRLAKTGTRNTLQPIIQHIKNTSRAQDAQEVFFSYARGCFMRRTVRHRPAGKETIAMNQTVPQQIAVLRAVLLPAAGAVARISRPAAGFSGCRKQKGAAARRAAPSRAPRRPFRAPPPPPSHKNLDRVRAQSSAAARHAGVFQPTSTE